MARIQLTRLPRDDDELHELVKALWGVEISRAKVCPEHDAPFQWFADSFFARQPQTLSLGSRGLSGKSYGMAALGLTQATVLGADVNILGGSMAQSQNLHAHMKAFWEHENAPAHMVESNNTELIVLSNKSRIRPLTASQKTVRGPHPARLLLDEVDEIQQDIFDAAKGQPMPQPNWLGAEIPAQTAMTSTWQYPDGVMMKEMKRQREQGLKIYSWCVASDSLVTTARGEVPIQEVTDQDLVLTRGGFRQVQHVTFMGHKPTIRLDVGDQSLYLTGDHRVATPGGWLHASALATDTMSPVRSNPSVLRGELVVLPAMGSAGLVPPGTRLVLGGGDEIEVLDVHASSVPAEMIRHQAIWDGSHYVLPDPAVGGDSGSLLRTEDDTSYAVAVALRARPVDAASGEHGNIVLPVWDIGVEGEHHEFIANGVLVHNCYRENLTTHGGWLSPEFVEQKRLEMPSEMWRVEYELGEPSIGNRAFDHEAIERVFADEEPKYLRKSKNVQETRIADFDALRSYVIAADWAKTQDFTVITVWDATSLPMKMVYYVRVNRMDWQIMVEIFNRLQKEYRAEGIHDATGLGGVVSDYIDGDVWNFQMVGTQRKDMLSDYIAAVERGHVSMPRIETLYLEHKYASWEDLFKTGKDYHLPDSVCSAALAWRLVGPNITHAAPIVTPGADSNWMGKAIDHNRELAGEKSIWTHGEVRVKGEHESAYDLMY